MKKKILTLISLSLVAIFALFSGCSGASILEFERKFFGDNNGSIPNYYTETVTYDVKSGDYGKLKKDSTITAQDLTYDIQGTFTTKLTVLGPNEASNRFSEAGIDTDLNYNYDPNKAQVYYYETELSVIATYEINGEQLAPTTDFIKSKVYFMDTAQSLSPIWSQTIGEYTYLVEGSENKIQVNKVEIDYTTTYYKNTYKIQQKYSAYKYGEDNKPEQTVKTFNLAYVAKTLIDNNQLLFAIRNVKNIAKDSSTSIPTLSPVYGVAKTLSIKNVETKTKTLTNFNGAQSSQLDVPVTCYEFYVNSDKNSGVQKYVSVQNAAASNAQGDSLPLKAHVVEYAEPLSVMGGNFRCIGALVYTLKSASNN